MHHIFSGLKVTVGHCSVHYVSDCQHSVSCCSALVLSCVSCYLREEIPGILGLLRYLFSYQKHFGKLLRATTVAEMLF